MLIENANATPYLGSQKLLHATVGVAVNRLRVVPYPPEVEEIYLDVQGQTVYVYLHDTPEGAGWSVTALRILTASGEVIGVPTQADQGGLEWLEDGLDSAAIDNILEGPVRVAAVNIVGVGLSSQALAAVT